MYCHDRFAKKSHVDQVLEEDVHALFPAEEQVTTGQEDSHRVAAHMMNPALLNELAHTGVYPREACFALDHEKSVSYFGP